MKFNIDIDEYKGEDLILMTGAPGSKWSSVHMRLLLNEQINRSECRENRFWGRQVKDIGGDNITIGNHRGSYWGPGNYYGEKFFEITTMTKKDIVEEFMKPFDNWDKIKVIKSHWFSYNLEYLSNLFPKAKILSCYANDIDCFHWWHKVGGWGIVYPSYSWYENDGNMLDKIKEENYNIMRFCIDRDIPLERIKSSELYSKLGLPSGTINDKELNLIKKEDSLMVSKVGIYSREYKDIFGHLKKRGNVCQKGNTEV